MAAPVVQKSGSAVGMFGRRVAVIAGGQATQALGVVDECISSLDESKVERRLWAGVPANPSVSLVNNWAAELREWKADAVIGIGGGSTLDVAKAVAVSAATGKNYRFYLSGIRGDDDVIHSALPIVAIPTLFGSGSEVNGTSVLTDDETGLKLSAHSNVCCPQTALIDPAYSGVAPRRLLGAGIADALCHAIEAGLSARATVASDTFARAAILDLLAYGPDASWGDGEAVARCHWASLLAGHALSIAGSTVTHPIAHAVSAITGAHHGEIVPAIELATLEVFAKSWGVHGEKIAKWFSLESRTTRTASKELHERLRDFLREIGTTRSAHDLGVSSANVELIVDQALNSGSRGLANTTGTPLSAEQVREVVLRSLGR